MESDQPSQPSPGDNRPHVFSVAPEQPSQTPTGPSMTNVPPPVSSAPGKNKFAGKKLLGLPVAIIVLIFVILGGSAAAYFGLVVPNKPENVWKRALSNTAEGYDRLVTYVDDNSDMKGSKVKGNIKLEGVVAADGNIEAESYEGNSNFKFDFGALGTRYNVEGRSIMLDGVKNPDLYLKVTGIKGIGDFLVGSPYESLGPTVDALDNQWVFVDHTLLDQLASTAGSSQPSFTQEDVVQIARAVGDVNRQYLFTTDSDKRVFKVVKEVGKEERDGRSVYHFEVGYNKENLKKYVQAVKDKLKDTKIKELVESSGSTYDEAFDIESVLRDIDELKGDETADVWVDMKTKLVRIVRFSDKKNKENYVELGIPYNGGDEVPFSLLFNSDDDPKGKMQLTYKVNTRTDKSNLKVDGNFDADGQSQKFNANVEIEPNDKPVEVTKPEGAKPLMELIGALYGGIAPALNGGLEDPSALDQLQL